MERKKLRKWNNIIHRDLGYFFFGVTIIYGLSGIALNHKVMDHWNPEYVIKNESFTTNKDLSKNNISEVIVLELLSELGEEDNYKKYYYPADNQLKIFITGGSVLVNINAGEGTIETIKKRPVFNETSFLHYNPNIWWTYFSDVFAGALIIMAITGLLIVRGKNGLKWRGAIIATAGLIIPILFLFVWG